ncbi:MAG: DUF3316 domain-containing protein [Prevotella sp.]|nr:DUF3316 domain-containing protein [Prevotella sp.]
MSKMSHIATSCQGFFLAFCLSLLTVLPLKAQTSQADSLRFLPEVDVVDVGMKKKTVCGGLVNTFAATRIQEYMLGIGPANVLDTYLSPETYKGSAVSLSSVDRRLRFDTETRTYRKWQHQSTWQVSLNMASNRANNADYLGGSLAFQYDWLRRVNRYLAVGPMVEAFLGGLYNTRNGNNPAQLYAQAEAGVTLLAEKSFSFLNKNFGIDYEASLPFLGATFSPQYGQSYYEIFTRGNYDHNIAVTSPFNALSLRQRISLDFRLGRHVFRIGYMGNYRQREVNNLKYHDYDHQLLLGYTKYFTVKL